ncbi:MAG: YARHG domain-containing protein [Clostridia bacterium]|nr:YARHG domain-containing protein [Clostridia bacterium]
MKCNICGGEIPEGQNICKYCGNVMATTKKEEEKTVPPVRRQIEMPPKHTPDTVAREKIYQPRRNPEGFCSKCGRPLDGVTQKCIVCDVAEVSQRAYTNENYRIRENQIMAQKKKKKKKQNTALKIFLSILLMIILFSVAVYGAIKLAGSLGIGGASENDDEPTVVETQKPRNTADPNWKAEVEETPEPTEEPTKAPERTPEPVETGDPVAIRGGEYLYPSDTHLISEGELKEMSRLEIKRIYWEIYARHGYTFDDDLADYFENNHKWYMPTTSDISKVESQFNSIEKRNIKTIFDYQKKMGWR